jgi:hypothetical protein
VTIGQVDVSRCGRLPAILPAVARRGAQLPKLQALHTWLLLLLLWWRRLLLMLHANPWMLRGCMTLQ